MAKQKFYPIMDGRGHTAIFDNWDDCKAFRDANPEGAKYKKFDTLFDATAYIAEMLDIPMDTTQPVKATKKAKDEMVLPAGIADADEFHALAYTDGSYNQETTEYGYAVRMSDAADLSSNVRILHGKNTAYNESRNIAAECFAAIRAMEEAMAAGYKKLTIRHDYKGVGAWITGEWKNTNTPISKFYKNRMSQLTPFVEVNFEWVQGHSGEAFNEEVDRIAKNACGVK